MAESSGIWQGLPFGFGYGFLIRLLWNRIAWELWNASTKEYSFDSRFFFKKIKKIPNKKLNFN